MSIKIKICGMRDPGNIAEVVALKPDLLGFIFFKESPRFVNRKLDPEILAGIPESVTKTGVFVNAALKEIMCAVRKYSLDAVQLHGKEGTEICNILRKEGLQVIKSFSISDGFPFKSCAEYIPCTDFLLFDASTRKYGGSGYRFDWNLLAGYEFDHPFILSGGISPGDEPEIKQITNRAFRGIDLNSRFEVSPALKDVAILKKFLNNLMTE